MINFIALFLKKEPLRSFDMRKIFQAFKWHLLFSLLLIHWWVIDMHLIHSAEFVMNIYVGWYWKQTNKKHWWQLNSNLPYFYACFYPSKKLLTI